MIIDCRSKANEVIKNLSKSKKWKNEKFENLTYIKTIKEFIFLTFGVKNSFNLLRQIFIKTIIVQNFDLESYIWIKTDLSGYAIGKVLS